MSDQYERGTTIGNSTNDFATLAQYDDSFRRMVVVTNQRSAIVPGALKYYNQNQVTVQQQFEPLSVSDKNAEYQNYPVDSVNKK